MISYDSIKEKVMELVTQSNIPQEQMQLFHEFPYELFWFACKEAMNCDGIVIADYIFTTKMNERLDSLTKSLGYQTLQIHFDAEIEIAYPFPESKSGILFFFPPMEIYRAFPFTCSKSASRIPFAASLSFFAHSK